MCLFGQSFGFGARFVQTNYGRICRLFRCDILSSALTELLGCLRYIENIVDDLEGEAKSTTEPCDRSELFRICVCTHRPEPNGGRQNRGGFVLMNVTQAGARCLFSFRFQISYLSGDELLAAGCYSNFTQ